MKLLRAEDAEILILRYQLAVLHAMLEHRGLSWLTGRSCPRWHADLVKRW